MNIIFVALQPLTIIQKMFQKSSGFVVIVSLSFCSIIQIETLMRADDSFLDKKGSCENYRESLKMFEQCCGAVAEKFQVINQKFSMLFSR